MAKQKNSYFIRNFVFGVEDSLVSTVGLLSGVASAGVDRKTIFMTGTILIFVEAFSMAVGSFLSEESAEEYEHKKVNKHTTQRGSIIMFVSYFVSGFIPLFPYISFERGTAFVLSIFFSLLALFLLGIINALLFKINLLKKGLEMLILGGVAIAAGVIVGNITNSS